MNKYLYLFVSTTALVASCNREIDSPHSFDKTTGTQIRAYFGDSDKTVLADDEMTVLWNPHEEITVFGDGSGVKFTSLNSKPTASTVFASDKALGGSEIGNGQVYIYAIYPYSSSNARNDDVLTLTVPSSQVAVEGSFGRGAYPSAGRSKSNDIAFYNVCGGIRFSLSQSGIGKVVLTGNNDETLAGKVQVQFDKDGHPVVVSVIDGVKSITLSAPDNGEFQTGKWYYISVLPTDFTKGYGFEFVKRTYESERGTRTTTNQATVKRSCFGSIENVDKGVVFSEDVSFDQWQKDFLKRADALLHCPWTPLMDVNSSGSKFVFPAGVTVEPIPYGGTGETDKFYTFVGVNVSFYTFQSIVNNPKSNFYKESCRELFDRPFYGSICTSCVAYCWGVPSPFTTLDIYRDRVPYLELFAIESVTELKVTETACWYSASTGGHIIIITDIERDESGKMLHITTTEAGGGRVHAETYTPEELQAFLDEKSENIKKLGEPEGVKYYRYDWTNYRKYLRQPGFSEQERVPGYVFPDALCTERGDKVSYPYGTAVVINVLSDKFTGIELYKDDELYKSSELVGTNDVTFENLPVGMYKACLVNGSDKSSFTCFQIGATNFAAKKSGEKLVITYDDPNSEIQYITMNNGNGSVCYYVEKVSTGKYEFTQSLGSATNIRVHFAGKYGTYRGGSKKIQ